MTGGRTKRVRVKSARAALMMMMPLLLLVTAFAAFAAPVPRGESRAKAKKKILVAHRGASAYAPEHTLEAYKLAVEQGADFVEQDLQITKDGVLVCLHDLTLERTTDAEQVFPDRYREEKSGGETTATVRRSWYVSDFTLAEIKRLDAGSWFGEKFKGARVPTWQEAIDEIRGKAGLYPETKGPEVYGSRGFDMERLVLAELQKNKLERPGADKSTPVIIQSFSAASLRKMRGELKTKLPLVLLVGEGQGARWLSPAGIDEVKAFAAGIGPAKNILDEAIVARAHAAGLTVTPYTFRSSGGMSGFKSVREEMDYYLYTLGVDALFTDNPDQFPRRK